MRFRRQAVSVPYSRSMIQSSAELGVRIEVAVRVRVWG